jgi:hypothetical protein
VCVEPSDIIYADAANGSDSAGCGDAPGPDACRSLGKDGGALDKVEAGREIVVASGTFAEGVDITHLDVTLIGQGQARIRPPAFEPIYALRTRAGARVVVYDMELLEGNGLASGMGLRCDQSDVELHRVVVADNDSNGIMATGCQLQIKESRVSGNGRRGLQLSSSTLLMEASEVVENSFHGLRSSDGSVTVLRTELRANAAGGLFLEDTSFTVENSFIVRNGNSVANPVGPAGGLVIRNSTSPGTQILRHNTIAENRGPVLLESAGVDCGGGPAVTCVSNIVVENQTPSSTDQWAGQCTFSYSNVAGITTGTGNIDVAPSFVDVAADDFHLQSGSAGIDLANPSSITAVDFDGDARPQGPAADMGADEVVVP